MIRGDRRGRGGARGVWRAAAVGVALALGSALALAPAPRGAQAQPEPSPEMRALAAEAGQLLVVGFRGVRVDQPGAAWVVEEIAQGRVGGVLLLSHNIVSPRQLAQLISGLKARAPGGRLFVMIDQEGGAVARLGPANGFPRAPSAWRIARAGEAAQRAAFESIAETLRRAGVDVNLAPVVDVYVRPGDPAVGRQGRSYGVDPETVARVAGRFVRAHRAQGVRTCAKHFPGMGAARADPHWTRVSVAGRWRAARDLAPFAAVIAQPVAIGCVMTTHILAPGVAGQTIVTFSRRAVERLRGPLGFDGVVISDDLQMAATGRRDAVSAARDAIIAGHDMVIVANFQGTDRRGPRRFREAIAQALADGRLSERALRRSLARVRAWRP